VTTSSFPTRVSALRHHHQHHRQFWNTNSNGWWWGGGGFGGGGYGGDGSSAFPYGSYVSPYYDSAYPYDLSSNPYVVNSGAVAAAADQAESQPEQGRQVEVIVPDPNAEVWFNGTKASKLGGRRYFPVDSRPAPYVATVKAAWSEAGQTTTVERNINVGGGANVVVDFRKAGPVVSGP
jgi:hypothetical protein